MKTRYKTFKFTFILVLILGLSSCNEEFLQTVPTDAVSTEIALGSPENMMLAMNGVHRAMYAQNGMVSSYAGQQFILPTAEYGASDAMHSTVGNGWFNACIQWNMHTSAKRTDPIIW